MTTDEELNRLEDNIRRLKIEFEAYFSGGQPRAPHDSVFRVETVKYSWSDKGLKIGFSFQNYVVARAGQADTASSQPGAALSKATAGARSKAPGTSLRALSK